MKLRTLTILLAALACPAAGAAAQQGPSAPATDYHSNPTPEEMSQTKALNAKQAEIRGVSAAGQTGSAIDASNDEAQKQYQEKLRANEALHNLYDQQMKEYERKYGHPGSYAAPAKS